VRIIASTNRDLPDTIQESGVGPQGDRDWMAPEQQRGVRGDCRSDIYAVGVLAYRLLCGKLPPRGEGAALNSDRMKADGIASSWTTVLLRALSVETRHRYQWIEDLQSDMEPLLGSEASARRSLPTNR
jgi:eukaryotic-like serine/threonine-protein kinase